MTVGYCSGSGVAQALVFWDGMYWEDWCHRAVRFGVLDTQVVHFDGSHTIKDEYLHMSSDCVNCILIKK